MADDSLDRPPHDAPGVEARADDKGNGAGKASAAEPDEPVVEEETAEEAAAAAGTEAAGQTAVPGEPVESIEDVARARDELAEKLAQEHDRLLRLAADFDNFRKRSKRQEAESAARVRADTIRTFLVVMDNLLRAISHAESMQTAAGIAEGLRLVEKQFLEILAGHGVARLESSVGKAFDPAVHDAVSRIESPDAPPGSVVTELQAGYTIGDKLLRPALVVVATAPAVDAQQPAAPIKEASGFAASFRGGPGGSEAPGAEQPAGMDKEGATAEPATEPAPAGEAAAGKRDDPVASANEEFLRSETEDVASEGSAGSATEGGD